MPGEEDGRRAGLKALKQRELPENPLFLLLTFTLWLRLESELQREIGTLTQSVASEREDGFQQHQTALKVGPDCFLHNAAQSESEKHWERCTPRSR